MKSLERSIEDLRDVIKILEARVGESYPSFEDIIRELRIRDCSDVEIAFWLGTCDSKLGDIPLDCIREGNIEGVYRRLRGDKAK